MIDRKLYEILNRALGETSIKNYSSEFSSRIIVQKVLYLLTHGISAPNVSLPYKWEFYLHGPYSSDIAQMLHHMNDVRDEISHKQVDLTKKDLMSLENFRQFREQLMSLREEERELSNLPKAELFEILGTLVYLAGQLEKDEIKIRAKFKAFKPSLIQKLTENAFSMLYQLLNEFGYI